MLDEYTVSIRVRFIILITGLALLAAGTYAYHRLVPNSEIKDLFAVVGAGIALLALVYSAFSFSLSNQIRIEEIHQQKINRSIDLISRFSDPEMAQLIGRCAKLREDINDLMPNDAVSKIEEDPEIRSSLISILNFFEEMGIYIRKNVVEEDMLKEFFSPVVSRYWVSFSPWIQNKRGQVKTNDLFKEIEFIINRWQV